METYWTPEPLTECLNVRDARKKNVSDPESKRCTGANTFMCVVCFEQSRPTTFRDAWSGNADTDKAWR